MKNDTIHKWKGNSIPQNKKNLNKDRVLRRKCEVYKNARIVVEKKKERKGWTKKGKIQ